MTCSCSGRAKRWVDVPVWPNGHIILLKPIETLLKPIKTLLFSSSWAVFEKLARRQDETPRFGPRACLLVAIGARFGGLPKEGMLNPARVSQSWAIALGLDNWTLQGG